MIIKGKKGQRGSQQLLFYTAELIVGAMILFLGISLGMQLLSEKPQDIIAKDLGYTIMSISGSPSNLYFAYQPDTRDYIITISRDNIVTVDAAKDGKAQFNFYLLKNILINPEILNGIKSIPISFNNKEISFQSLNQADKESICNTIPASFNTISNYVSIEYPDSASKEEKAYLKSIKNYLELKSKINKDKKPFKIDDTIFSPSIDINLRFDPKSSKILTINYYEPPSQKANNAKIACYISAELKTIKDFFTTTEEVASTKDKVELDVVLGSFDDVTTNKISAETMGDKIYSALEKAITK